MSVSGILLSLFLVMLVGIGAGRFKLFDDSARRAFSKFVFYIATSAIVIESVATIQVSSLHTLPRFLIINTIVYTLLYIGLYAVLRLVKASYKTGASIFCAGMMANMVFLGLPLIRALYGSEGILFAIAFITIPMSITDIVAFYLLGHWRSGRAPLKVVLKDFIQNPIVISSVVGALVLASRVVLPATVLKSLDLLASCATGLALFSVGLFLSSISWRHFKLRAAVAASVFKLAIMPALVLLVCRVFGLHGVPLAVTVLMAAMPSAVFCMVVATEYDFDERATADSILLSSVLFLATAPLWVKILQ